MSTNETAKHDATKPANGTKPKAEEEKAARAPKAILDASEAVRLMLTTLKRVPSEQRAKVLATLASLA